MRSVSPELSPSGNVSMCKICLFVSFLSFYIQTCQTAVLSDEVLLDIPHEESIMFDIDFNYLKYLTLHGILIYWSGTEMY